MLLTSLLFFLVRAGDLPLLNSCYVRFGHLRWIDNGIGFGPGHEANLQRSGLQREIVV